MESLTLNEMKRLAGHQSSLCISIYLPTHRRGRETEQDPIRYGNQLRAAETELAALEMRPREIDGFLAAARALLDDADFWRHQQDGLAIFIDSAEFHAYRLPFEVPTRTVVADRFFLNPLLPLFTNNGHFYILALSLNESRLFEATRFSVGEIDKPGDAPASMMAVTARRESYSDAETRSHAGDEDKRVGQYLNTLDKSLMAVFGDGTAPLVIAGDVSLLPIYRQVTNYGYVVEDGPRGNPELLRPEELHAQAWPFVEARFRADLDAALGQYGAAAANGLGGVGLEAVVPAATHGRVSVAFVPPGLEVWGVVAADTGEVTRTDASAPGALELEGFVAAQTLLNGGEVFAVAREEMPEQEEVAAILRF